MQRVMIIGGPGSGKSTLAQQLGNRCQLPVFHLDAIYWKPGWVASAREEFDQQVLALAEREQWIIDGNYSRTMPQRAARADTIIFLDLPRLTRLWRVLRRRVVYHNTSREDMGEGCPEKLDPAFIGWAWSYPTRNPEVPDWLDEMERQGKTVIRLRSPRDVRTFLARLDHPISR